MSRHLHGEARPHVGRLVVPHPLVALARRRVGVRRRVRHLQALPRGADRAARPSSRSSSRRRSTRTSASPPAAGRRRRSRGATTTARAASASSATARRCAPRRAFRAPMRIRISRSRALLAAGLYGIEHELELGPAFEGNAYESDVERFPHALREAIARLENGHDRAAAARRRGRRPLPELRAHRAAALRRGRHVLRAGADVRAWLGPSSASRRTSSQRRGGTGRSTPR